MSDSPQTRPTAEKISEALAYLVANYNAICTFQGTPNQKAKYVEKLLIEKFRIRCVGYLIILYLQNYAKFAGDTTTKREVEIDIAKELITGILADSDYVDTVSDPVDAILNVATKVFGCCHVFGSESTLIGVNNRHIDGGTLVETKLSRDIRLQIHKKESDDTKQSTANDVTVIVGGPSGGGKTVSLIAQSRKFEDDKPQVFIAYIDPPRHLTNLTAEQVKAYKPRPKDASTKDGKPEPSITNIKCQQCKEKASSNEKSGMEILCATCRDNKVLSWLVDALLDTLPLDVVQQLMKITSAKPLQLLIVLDEVGGEALNCLVRALCAIKPSMIRNLFVQRLPDKHKGIDIPSNCFTHVTFRLAAAGTGIGVSETGMVGTLTSEYEPFWAYDGSLVSMDEIRASNRAVFMAYLEAKRGSTLDEKRIPVLFWNMISENARMAAILGSLLKNVFIVFDSQADRVELLYMFDVTQFIGNAIVSFKSLNGIAKQDNKALVATLLKAVRMHWFPQAPTRGSDIIQTAFGLIVDRSVWPKNQTGKLEDGESSKMMPPFTASFLGMLCGNPVIRQSIISGDSLEEYTLTLSFLLGCAACDSNLFLAALDKGRLMPLTGPVPFVTKDLPLQSIVHDLQRDSQFAATGNLEEAVTNAIMHFTYTLEQNGEPCEHHIAAFRSFAKMPFADIFMFLNGSLILIQSNDHQDGYKADELSLELWKMGWGGPAGKVAKTRHLIKEFMESLYLIIDKAVMDDDDDTPIGDTTAQFIVEVQKLLGPPTMAAKTADARMTSLINGLEKLLSESNNVSSAPSSDTTIEEVRKLLTTTKTVWEGKLDGPRELLGKLLLAWHKKTGKKVKNIYRCFVTPTAVETKYHETNSFPDESLTISDTDVSWTATLQEKNRFVSVDLVKFLTFDRNRTRVPPYNMCELPSVLLAKEPNKSAPALPSPDVVEQANNNVKANFSHPHANDEDGQEVHGSPKCKKSRSEARI